MRRFLFCFVLLLIAIGCMPFGKKTLKIHFDQTDIIFVDPCYFCNDEDLWETYCEDFAKNKKLDQLGCQQGICTSVGDVYPDVLVDLNTNKIIGELCSDSSLLGCFRLADVLRHNPDYAREMETYPSSYAVIKNFTGDIVFETKKRLYYDERLPITSISGNGSIVFHSGFTDEEDDTAVHLYQN